MDVMKLNGSGSATVAADNETKDQFILNPVRSNLVTTRQSGLLGRIKLDKDSRVFELSRHLFINGIHLVTGTPRVRVKVHNDGQTCLCGV